MPHPALLELIEQLGSDGRRPEPLLQHAIECWKSGAHLGLEEARRSFETLFGNDVTDTQIAELLCYATPELLDVDEIAGFASVLRDRAHRLPLADRQGLGDTCGTGGDTIATFNVSTAVAFILAAAEGTRIAKHGNRAFSSSCGSADVLERVGVAIDLDAADVARCIEQTGIGFLFAPVFHAATKRVQAVRKLLAGKMPAGQRLKTVFNVLGPLSNPAWPEWQLLGVYDPRLLGKLAAVLGRLGLRRAVVVHGRAEQPGLQGKGLDEVSTLGATELVELRDGSLRELSIPTGGFGLAKAEPGLVAGGDVETNARILEGLLRGTVLGPRRDLLLANAAVGLYLAEDAGGSIESVLASYVAQAAELVDSGAAYEKLRQLRASSRALSRIPA